MTYCAGALSDVYLREVMKPRFFALPLLLVSPTWAATPAQHFATNVDLPETAAEEHVRVAAFLQRCKGPAEVKQYNQASQVAGASLGLPKPVAIRTAALYTGKCFPASSYPNEWAGSRNPPTAAVGNRAAARNASGSDADGPTAPGRERSMRLRAVPDFHAHGDSSVAPEPTWAAWAHSFVLDDKRLIAADLGFLRANIGRLEFEKGPTGLASTTPELQKFVEWVRTVPESQLPTIQYTTLPEKELGRYTERRKLARLNYYLKDQPVEVRSAALLHELYHHWDLVASPRLDREYFGITDYSELPDYEYDPYYVMALYWQKVRRDDLQGPAARYFDRLPQDADAVRSAVDRHVAARGKK